MSEPVFLSEAERQQLLVAWNDTAAEFPRDLCIHHLFAAQAARTPHAVAVRYGTQQVTFQELDRRANQLAHYLQAQGVGPDVLVGISLKRSPELIVSLLGVLKAGGGYLPLDPFYPQERLAFMLADTEVSVLLTQERFLPKLPAQQAQVICLDADAAKIECEGEEAPLCAATPEHLCYVLYTSGSTGTPKGVVGLHRGAVNRFAWMWHAYPFAAGEVCCQKTSLHFVDSVWEIWGPLLQGVPLVIIPDDDLQQLSRLLTVLQEQSISRIVLVPSLLRMLLDAYPDLQARVPDLKLWVCSGEALSVDLAQCFQERLPNATLLNLYGMSEAAGDSTCFVVQRPVEESGAWSIRASVPIGRPIANTHIYILDDQLQPVPTGTAGELYVGGAGLARGYWRRPDWTAERFVPHPFVAGERLYRTGDLARYRADGNIEYLGRLDDQVKIRGNRVELQDVETALRAVPGVSGVYVMALPDASGDKQLVAYLVPVAHAAVERSTTEQLRAVLQAKVPPYMVPSAFVWLEALPLTPHGKVDRQALPAPDFQRAERESAYVAPRSQVEDVLAELWADVCGVQRVGVHDRFFAFGGQSLMAMQIIARVRDLFQVELPAQAIFETPTVVQLAQVVQQRVPYRQPDPQAYWKKQLAGEPPLLALPFDRPKQLEQTFRPERLTWQWPTHVVEACRAWSRREGVTLFLTLLAIFKTLLYRYTSEEDLWVGMPIGNAGADSTLALRTQVTGEMSFRTLLHQVRDVALAAEAHQALPFEKMAASLWPERSAGRTSLLQARFGFANGRTDRGDLQSQADIGLFFAETEQGIEGVVTYNGALFDEATITRMSGHFQQLLTGVLSDPEQPVAVLPLLTEQERQQLIYEWNDTTTDYPRDATIADLFEEQAAQRPEAVALIDGERRLSYRELNERANRLAHDLIKRGVTRETLVGFSLRRSVEMVVTALAILKAGGSCLPLDVSYPAERIAMMIEDTEVKLILTQQEWVASLSVQEAEILCLETIEAQLTEVSPVNPVRHSQAEDLCYLVYTSGSTGRPKGVCLLHRGVVRLVKQTNYLPFTAEETFLQFAPISFDAALYEIWGALLNGSRLVLVQQEKPSLAELGRVIRETGVTTMLLTAGLFQQMVNSQLDDLRNVRYLLSGGDVVSLPHVQKVVRELTETNFVDVYGPTECTTYATYCPINDADSLVTSVPIGRPISNTEVYVLDAQRQPVPLGVRGELYIGGDGVARGYWRRPELTAERFVPHPFRADPQARLYKTGDIVRFQADGNLEFVGRIDNQVKIRGFRIELGEVEAVLSQHPDVQEAVVIVREFAPGDKRLVAYVVPKPGVNRTGREFRRFLQEKLPDYMVPNAVVLLDELVLTRNGKVDRRALPAPEQRTEQAEGYVAPRTEVEDKLAQIWAEMLGVQQVGVHDHFFDLGGHSLLAAQLMERLRQEWQVELPLRALFEAPTVAQLAVAVEARREASDAVSMFEIPKVARTGELAQSFAQQRLWFLDRMEPGSPLYNMTFAVQMQGHLHVDTLQRVLDEIVRRHEALRTTFAELDGQPVQVIAPVRGIDLPVIALDGLPAEDRAAMARQLAQEVAEQPFDLAQGPLFRTKLLRIDAQQHLLILHMHHIVSDGWSIGVLIREIALLYDAFAKGLPSPLPELTVQYADYAAWHQRWLQSGVLTEQLAYWKRQLSGHPPLLQLPTDRLRPHVQTYNGAVHHFLLPAQLIEGCTALSQQESATLFMTLFAAFNVLLYRYTGQDDLLVGSPFASRMNSEIEKLIGFFVNTLVLRTDLSGSPSFRELLHRVRDVVTGAHVHQDLPFEKLIEELQPERLRSHAPLLQVMFAYDRMSRQTYQLDGLTIVPYELKNDTAKFDLTLFLVESGQGLHGTIEYNTDMYDEATIVRMQGHFETLLAAIVDDPEQAIDTLPLLTAAESAQLAAWYDPSSGADVEVCIFSEQMQPVPLGVPGALYVSDVEAARVKWQRPELRAELAVPHPLRKEAGALLYKTGDWARFLPDGTVQFLGLLERQVRLRGCRVDLGEWEAALLEHPHLRAAYVQVMEEVPGLKRLIAYVVPVDEQAPRATELRAFLQERLPEPLVPSVYVRVDELPRLENGQVDHSQLPVPEMTSLERETAYVAPRTPLEEVLAILWAEVLGVEEIGVCDNFFDRGGYSLLGIQVIARIREAFSIEVPLKFLFDAPTVESLAALMLADDNEGVRLERTAQMLLRMAQMSEEEVEAMLLNRNGG